MGHGDGCFLPDVLFREKAYGGENCGIDPEYGCSALLGVLAPSRAVMEPGDEDDDGEKHGFAKIPTVSSSGRESLD